MTLPIVGHVNVKHALMFAAGVLAVIAIFNWFAPAGVKGLVAGRKAA